MSIIKKYKKTIEGYNADKANLEDNTKKDAETNAVDSKIQATTDVLESYIQNQQNYASSKVQAQMAQQNAQNATKAYMNAVGLGGQGIAETTMANSANNYANAVAKLEAQKNQDNATVRDTYMAVMGDIGSQYKSDMEKVKASNAETLTTNISNALDAEGNYNADKLNQYKATADSMLESGELSTSDYNNIVNLYNNYIESATEKENEVKAEVNKALANAGVTDTTPISHNDVELSASNREALKKWIEDTYDMGASKVDKQVNDILSAEDGEVVTINHKGTNTKVVVYKGKIYFKEQGTKKGETKSTEKDENNPLVPNAQNLIPYYAK